MGTTDRPSDSDPLFEWVSRHRSGTGEEDLRSVWESPDSMVSHAGGVVYSQGLGEEESRAIVESAELLRDIKTYLKFTYIGVCVMGFILILLLYK